MQRAYPVFLHSTYPWLLVFSTTAHFNVYPSIDIGHKVVHLRCSDQISGETRLNCMVLAEHSTKMAMCPHPPPTPHVCLSPISIQFYNPLLH
ncbi:hypothetical protein IWX92DRAFT_380799 [Phyllosticta citricarpa]